MRASWWMVGLAWAVLACGAGCKGGSRGDEGRSSSPSATPIGGRGRGGPDTIAGKGAETTTRVPKAAPNAAGPRNLASLMPDCPNAAPGAQTILEDMPGGVVVTVLADDEDAANDVRARAQRLLDVWHRHTKHATDGSGGGHGPCPVVLRGTTLAVSDTPGGARIEVKAKSGAEVEWLRAETRARAGGLPESVAVGAVRMLSCPSAVPGATTAVEDTADGVALRVTAVDPDAIGEIRTRTNRVVAALAARAGEPPPPRGVSPQLGTCPLLSDVGGIEAHDVPAGAEIVLHAAPRMRVARLQKDARSRAEHFGPRR